MASRSHSVGMAEMTANSASTSNSWAKTMRCASPPPRQPTFILRGPRTGRCHGHGALDAALLGRFGDIHQTAVFDRLLAGVDEDRIAGSRVLDVMVARRVF